MMANFLTPIALGVSRLAYPGVPSSQVLTPSSLLWQFVDDYPDASLGIEYTDTPDGFTGYPDGTYDYSGGVDTVSFYLTVNGIVIDEYTSGIGTSIGSVNNVRPSLLSIGRFMNG